MPASTRLSLLFALALSACSADSSLNAEGMSYTTTATNSGTPTTGTPGTTTTTNVPAYFEIIGDLELVSEDIDPLTSTIEIEYRNEELEVTCPGEFRAIDAATPVVNNDPDLPLYGWWSIDLAPGVSCPFGPDTILIGIGEWDPQLDAPAAAQNLIGTDLYALYVRLDISDPVWVFGASGTSEQFNGTTPPVSAAPLPDGTYQLRTLILLPAD